jgi:hypothetical protein
MKDIPKKIYLQIGQEDSYDDVESFKEFCEVSWCSDKMHDSDIEYILASNEPIPTEYDEETAFNLARDRLFNENGTFREYRFPNYDAYKIYKENNKRLYEEYIKNKPNNP